jgi:Flp pilus assembly protein TadG
MSMNIHVVWPAVKGALVAWTSANSRRLLTRLLRDEAGTYLVLVALMTPVLIGAAALGTEAGLWLYTQQSLQAAADSAAISAAWAYQGGNTASAELLTQAEAITASYGYVNGTNGVTVTVYPPPSASNVNGITGNYTAANGYKCSVASPYPCAIEVIVTQSRAPLLYAIWSSTPINISASAVALVPVRNCILALDPTASGAITVALLAAINTTNCGVFSDSNSSDSIEVDLFAAIVATGGTVGTVGKVQHILGEISPAATTGDPPIADPYAAVATPTPATATLATYTPPSKGTCTQLGTKVGSNYEITTSITLTAGKTYCNAVTVEGPNGVLTANAAGNYIFTDQITVASGGKVMLSSGASSTFVDTAADGKPFINVQSGGQVTFNAGTYILYAGQGTIITSAGTVTLGAGTYTLNAGTNANAIWVTGGTTTLGAGTYTVDGSIYVSGGGTVTVNPGTYTLYGGISVSGTGSTFASNSGTYTMTLAPPTAGAAAATSVSNGGTLTFGAGTFTMSQLTDSSTVTLNPGTNTNGTTIILNSDSTSASATMLTLDGGTLTGTGTIVFTTSTGQYPPTALNSTNGTLNLIAPTTGATPGIVLFGNNSTSGSNAMPIGTSFTFDVFSALTVTGSVYLPRGALQFAAFDFSTQNCTQIIADTIDVIGIAYFGDNCGGITTLTASSIAKLLQ